MYTIIYTIATGGTKYGNRAREDRHRATHMAHGGNGGTIANGSTTGAGNGDPSTVGESPCL